MCEVNCFSVTGTGFLLPSYVELRKGLITGLKIQTDRHERAAPQDHSPCLDGFHPWLRKSHHQNVSFPGIVSNIHSIPKAGTTTLSSLQRIL